MRCRAFLGGLVILAGTILGSGVWAVAFTDVSQQAFAFLPREDENSPDFAGGGAVGDCDRDGLPDVFFTGSRKSVLYRNRGDGTFEDVSEASGLSSFVRTRGAAFGYV